MEIEGEPEDGLGTHQHKQTNEPWSVKDLSSQESTFLLNVDVPVTLSLHSFTDGQGHPASSSIHYNPCIVVHLDSLGLIDTAHLQVSYIRGDYLCFPLNAVLGWSVLEEE